jgi:hypothetical protein
MRRSQSVAAQAPSDAISLNRKERMKIARRIRQEAGESCPVHFGKPVHLDKSLPREVTIDIPYA